MTQTYTEPDSEVLENDITLRLFAGEPLPGDDAAWAETALDALDTLRPVVQPLAAELTLGCRRLDIDLRDHGTEPAQARRLLRCASLPPGVIAEQYIIPQREESVSELTRAALAGWLRTALGQPCPHPQTHATCWTELRFAAVRARLSDELPFAGRETLRLKTDRGVFAAPLERRADGLWVSGPLAEWTEQPPFDVAIYNTEGEGSLDLRLRVPWTIFWQPGTSERAALSAALRQIVARGWWVDESDGPRAADLLDG